MQTYQFASAHKAPRKIRLGEAPPQSAEALLKAPFPGVNPRPAWKRKFANAGGNHGPEAPLHDVFKLCDIRSIFLNLKK